jgi:pyridoxamine 5'-phosphate oxidase
MRKETAMNFQDYVKFANEQGVCYIATAEGDQPRVRALRMWFADDQGFYFQTESVKSIYKQLKNNNKVELCFYAPGPNAGKMMRATGKVEFLNDLALKSKVLTERPFLKALGIKAPEDPLLVIFRVYSGEAYFWTMANNMKEAEIEKIKF